MTHDELRAARAKLGLEQTRMAAVLAVDLKSYQRWEASPDMAYSREVPPLVARVVQWLLDGFRPPEFPDQ